MNKTKLSLVVFVATTLISACGGGSSDSDAADKYIGTWDIPCSAESGASANGFVTLSKTGATALSGTSIVRGYAGTACAGPVVVNQEYPAALKIEGSATVSGKAAEKVISTAFDATDKDVAYIEGNRLFFGAEDSAKDAQGYPTQLDLVNGATRR